MNLPNLPPKITLSTRRSSHPEPLGEIYVDEQNQPISYAFSPGVSPIPICANKRIPLFRQEDGELHKELQRIIDNLDEELKKVDNECKGMDMMMKYKILGCSMEGYLAKHRKQLMELLEKI